MRGRFQGNTITLAPIRSFFAYWITMLAAGVFLFCCVLALQGFAALLLPRRWSLRASTFLQLVSRYSELAANDAVGILRRAKVAVWGNSSKVGVLEKWRGKARRPQECGTRHARVRALRAPSSAPRLLQRADALE